MTPDRDAAVTPTRDAAHLNEASATDAWLGVGPGLRFRDAMARIIQACDRALADPRLAATGELAGPLQRLVVDLRRERAAAVRCRTIFEGHIEAAAAEMRSVAAVTDDAYIRKIAAALEADTYHELAL